MGKLYFYAGVSGSALGILAGLIELSIGSQILPWIGNKENPVVLGLLTMLLSALALGVMLSTRDLELPSNNKKLAIFMGVLLPAIICFTTVGRLWYLPGSLLIIAALGLANEFWLTPSLAASAATISNTEPASRILGGTGSALILVAFALGFWKSQFSLFQSDVMLGAEEVRVSVLPMDFVRLNDVSSSISVAEDVEVSRVMIVYILLLLGAALGFFASLTASRLFQAIGGGIALTGLISFLCWLPAILRQVKYPAESLHNLMGSLSWGWYLAFAGASLTLLASLLRSQQG